GEAHLGPHSRLACTRRVLSLGRARRARSSRPGALFYRITVLVKVTNATFIGAATAPGRFPAPSRPEVAFAGRSNVGKSSAINRLVGRKGLARTSSTPGRTQQLNFFAIDDRLVLVDLPGYGYAKVSKAARDAWRPLVESYLGTRGVLAGVVLIVD